MREEGQQILALEALVVGLEEAHDSRAFLVMVRHAHGVELACTGFALNAVSVRFSDCEGELAVEE